MSPFEAKLIDQSVKLWQQIKKNGNQLSKPVTMFTAASNN